MTYGNAYLDVVIVALFHSHLQQGILVMHTLTMAEVMASANDKALAQRGGWSTV